MKLFWGEQPSFMPFGCGGRFFYRLQGSRRDFGGFQPIDAGTYNPMELPAAQFNSALTRAQFELVHRAGSFHIVIDGTANFARQFHLATQPDEGTSMTTLPGLDLRGIFSPGPHETPGFGLKACGIWPKTPSGQSTRCQRREWRFEEKQSRR
jgi:hypothetical protein